jgi:DNA-binding transcriptional LysR family regulator
VELDWLETFLAVADRGGFTAAGEQVHRSQSRVSAHIAALERELGVRLVDRSHRPATLTTAGEVFSRHARDIVAGVGAARSAVGALRGLEGRTIALLTTPGIGATVLPGVLAELAVDQPELQVELLEQGIPPDLERRFLAESIAMAVLPAARGRSGTRLREQVLWRERLVAVVPADHDLARAGPSVGVAELARHPLVVCADGTGGDLELLRMLAELGVTAKLRATTGTPQTLVALVRAAVGAGVVGGVALPGLDLSGLAVRQIDEPVLAQPVAAYWNEALLETCIGRRLHRAVTRAPAPDGAARGSGGG